MQDSRPAADGRIDAARRRRQFSLPAGGRSLCPTRSPAGGRLVAGTAKNRPLAACLRPAPPSAHSSRGRLWRLRPRHSHAWAASASTCAKEPENKMPGGTAQPPSARVSLWSRGPPASGVQVTGEIFSTLRNPNSRDARVSFQASGFPSAAPRTCSGAHPAGIHPIAQNVRGQKRVSAEDSRLKMRGQLQRNRCGRVSAGALCTRHMCRARQIAVSPLRKQVAAATAPLLSCWNRVRSSSLDE